MSNYKLIVSIVVSLLISSCSKPWNNPYLSSERFDNTLYSSFSTRPKHLDPARSYAANEWVLTQSVYETPLQYHYLKRPYKLITGILEKMPQINYYDKDNNISDKKNAAYSEYILQIKRGIMYQNHPAFVKSNLSLSEDELDNIDNLDDIKKTANRELIASDFVHQIKRIANPKLHSPIFSLMENKIIGLKELNTKLDKNKNKNLEDYEIAGVKTLGRYSYSIKVKGLQQQFLYWLAMPFFTAIPPEADKFYAQQGLIDKNITLDWYPVGTGAFQLTVNNPNKEMVLEKNPNFHDEYYPNIGEDSDFDNNLLVDKGKKLPFLDKVHFLLEKETVPYWNKFLLGFYDKSGISSDNFDQAIEVKQKGKTTLSPRMKDKNIRLLTNNSASVYYTAFNMLDDIVGLDNKYLRQAISIAIDEEEYISIFMNGRANAAMGPIPYGIFGANDDFNPVVYEKKDGVIKRKDIAKAKKLLEKAGFKDGVNPKTNKPLVLYFDTASTSSDGQSRLSWIAKQFRKLGIQLIVRENSYNHLQDKIDKGQIQMFELGWNADYPDPENFLFLLYGKNSKVKYGGENNTNYQNNKYDKLFIKMKNMKNDAKRQDVINEMVAILRVDAPWVWGFIPKSYGLYHSWLTNSKPHSMAKNTLKYLRINPQLRDKYRQKHNQVVFWPLIVFILIVIYFVYRFKKQ